MPKRKCRNLDGIRIEFNERERDLLEQAIIGNTIGKVTQGLGTALGGMGMAAGIIGGVFVFVGGISVFKDFLAKDRSDWEAKHLTQAKYDAYIMSRTTEWIAATRAAGRYGPDGAADPLSFGDWEMFTYGEPPLLYEQWADMKRTEATKARKRKLGYGYFQEWWEEATD